MPSDPATTPGDRDRGRELAARVVDEGKLLTRTDRRPLSRARGAMPQEMDGDEYGRAAEAIYDGLDALADRLTALAAPADAEAEVEAEAEAEAGVRWNAFTSAVYRATDRLAEHRDPAIRGAAAEVVAAIGRYVVATPPAPEGEAGGPDSAHAAVRRFVDRWRELGRGDHLLAVESHGGVTFHLTTYLLDKLAPPAPAGPQAEGEAGS